MTVRRDQVLLTTPIANENFTAATYERQIDIDAATKRLSGFVRLSGPNRKFLKSVAFTIDLTDAVMNTLMNFVTTQLVAQFPSFAGVRTSIEVTDPDVDPTIG